MNVASVQPFKRCAAFLKHCTATWATWQNLLNLSLTFGCWNHQTKKVLGR
jgi:hypothetical protein